MNENVFNTVPFWNAILFIRKVISFIRLEYQVNIKYVVLSPIDFDLSRRVA